VPCFGVNKSEVVEQRQNEGPHHRTVLATESSTLPRHFYKFLYFKYLLFNVLQQTLGHKCTGLNVKN